MEPGLYQMFTEDGVGLSLLRLHPLIETPLSRNGTVSDFNDFIRDNLCSLRAHGEDAFMEFVAAL